MTSAEPSSQAHLHRRRINVEHSIRRSSKGCNEPNLHSYDAARVKREMRQNFPAFYDNDKSTIFPYQPLGTPCAQNNKYWCELIELADSLELEPFEFLCDVHMAFEHYSAINPEDARCRTYHCQGATLRYEGFTRNFLYFQQQPVLCRETGVHIPGQFMYL
jgi:hypothetical protein